MSTVNYEEHLFKDLSDLRYAAGYLTAAFEEGGDVFLLALRDVVQAQGGMSQFSQMTKLNRENLYKMLSNKGNPRLSSIATILSRLGLELQFIPKQRKRKANAA
jgi:probable addiction module antidote protein